MGFKRRDTLLAHAHPGDLEGDAADYALMCLAVTDRAVGCSNGLTLPQAGGPRWAERRARLGRLAHRTG
jgi:hypothetical protein